MATDSSDDDDDDRSDSVGRKRSPSKRLKREPEEDLEEEDSGENNDNDDANPSQTPPRSSRQKRLRKSVSHYSPDTGQSGCGGGGKGRGLPLSEIAATRESIQLHRSDPNAVFLLHRFLFRERYRGRYKMQDIGDAIKDILEFSGYLSALMVAGMDDAMDNNLDFDNVDDAGGNKMSAKEAREAYAAALVAAEPMDRSVEKKMSIRAYQHTLPELKRMCGVLFLNFTPNTVLSKDIVVAKLLDFLRQPQKKAGRPPLKRKPTDVAYEDLPGIAGSEAAAGNDGEDDDDDDDDGGEDDSTGPTAPSDHQLRQWTRAFVRCYPTDQITVRAALELAASKFGYASSSSSKIAVFSERHQKRIKELLVEEL